MTTRPASAAPAPGSLAQRLQACTACHDSVERSGRDGYYPSLDGKPAAYLLLQMRNFREGRRHQATMERLLAPLDEAYLQEIAAFFAERRAPHAVPAAPAPDQVLSARGQALVRQGDAGRGVPACNACHGLALTGTLPAVPGLLGLPRNYLVAQLSAWRQGRRQASAPDCMAEVARRLTPDDLSAAAQWLAAQPLPAEPRPAAQPPGDWPLDCGSLGGKLSGAPR